MRQPLVFRLLGRLGLCALALLEEARDPMAVLRVPEADSYGVVITGKRRLARRQLLLRIEVAAGQNDQKCRGNQISRHDEIPRRVRLGSGNGPAASLNYRASPVPGKSQA